jgi:hypothetical protein
MCFENYDWCKDNTFYKTPTRLEMERGWGEVKK